MTETIPAVYPSIEELMPELLLTKIPASLAREIEHRYVKLGDKYLTDNFTEDGRRINAMMYTNRIENGLEEIVDAVFCILGWIFKHLRNGTEPPEAAYQSLMGLIEVYSIMSVEKERDSVA